MNLKEREHIFDEWMANHRGLLFKVIRAFGSTSADQEDLFQHIALQLWQSIPRYTDQVAITTWMYRVAFDAANGWKRKEIQRHGRVDLLGDTDTVLVQPANPVDPRLDSLFEQIAKLSEIDRSLSLMLLDGFSYREMSDVLGITEGNVGVRINRIKKRLAQKLIGESENEI